MADSLTAKLEGAEELSQLLRAAPEKIRKLAIRGALRKAGGVISKEAKDKVPVLAKATPTRKPGTVKRAIRVAVSKFARRAGDEGVFIGVRPLRGKRQRKLGTAGANNPNDPYYWRFLEFGTKGGYPIKSKTGKRLNIPNHYPRQVTRRTGGVAYRFMTNAARDKSVEAVETFMEEAIPQIEKVMTRNLARVR